MIYQLQGSLQAMADSEIAAMVDKEWLAKTKAGGDEHPLIKAFTIAHEGNSDIKLDGILTPIRWVKSAVGWIHEKLKLHTPVFNHHGAPGDNSYEGRVPIGEIVGSKLTEVGDKVATIAAMYIYPHYRNLKLDMASIEADITYAREGETVWPTGIEQITGIALADKNYSQPGFPEATLIGSIAAFAQGDENVTKTEVKSAAGVLELKPEDVFSADALTGSEAVRSFIIEEKRDAQDRARRLLDEKEKLKKDLDSQYAEEIVTLKAENLSFKTSTMFNSISEERKLDTGEKQYVDLQLKHFQSQSTEADGFKGDLNKFVDESLVDLGTLRPALGLESDEGGKDGKGEGGEGEDAQSTTSLTSPPMDNFESDTMPAQEDGMMDPKNNPLLEPLG